MTNLYDTIKQFLVFDSADDFYFLQVIQRRKENASLAKNSVTIKTYYITSKEHLQEKLPEIMTLCTVFNARAMITINRRSFKQVAFNTLRKVSEQIFNETYKATKNAYNSSCGIGNNESSKKWIVDIDSLDMNLVTEVSNFINTLQPVGDKILATLPTKNGYHLITTPFRLDIYNEIYPDCEVKKNALVNLII